MARKKRGRPTKNDSKKYGYRLRIDEEGREMIDFIKEKTGETTADSIRKALKMYYNIVKFSD